MSLPTYLFYGLEHIFPDKPKSTKSTTRRRKRKKVKFSSQPEYIFYSNLQEYDEVHNLLFTFANNSFASLSEASAEQRVRGFSREDPTGLRRENEEDSIPNNTAK